MTDSLDQTTKDQLVALARGAANAVPFVGGLIGELITEIIPGQRQERIVEYLRQLGERLEQMEASAARSALSDYGDSLLNALNSKGAVTGVNPVTSVLSALAP